MVVEFDPEGLEEFRCLVAGEGSLTLFLFEEGGQVLVKASGVEAVPGVEFGDHAQVYEPVMLEGFVEGRGGVCRNPPADGGHPEEFPGTGGVFFPCQPSPPGEGHAFGHKR